MTLLNLDNIEVRYKDAECIRGVSVNVGSEEIVTIIGSNGAGKTTILRTITGLKRVSGGSISFMNEDITRLAPQNIIRRGIGFVTQGRELFPRMTVLENLKLGAFIRHRDRQVRTDLETIFDLFPILRERKKQLAGSLSGGQQQMLAIARALMSKPVLLLLDEPSTGLAPIIVREIGSIIQNIARLGTGVLLVEQNASLALDMASRGYVLERGKITMYGKCNDLMTDKRLKQAYLGL